MLQRLEGLLSPNAVMPRLDARTGKQVLLQMSRMLAQVTELDPGRIFDGVIERERLGSTGVGEGVAIPHARLKDLAQPVGGFARLAVPVEFDAIDGQPCDLVFMLLAPDDGGADHLRALARISRVLRQAELRTAIRAAPNTPDALYNLLSGTAREHAA
jgi:PTS system nitrogen regulatory IIA component